MARGDGNGFVFDLGMKEMGERDHEISRRTLIIGQRMKKDNMFEIDTSITGICLNLYLGYWRL